MGPKTTELIRVLDELIAHLDGVGEDHWSSWMSMARAKIKNSDFRGVEEVTGSYGGMGSFSDLVIHPINNHHVKEVDVHSANSKLDKLRGDVYELANYIKRNADIGNKP